MKTPRLKKEVMKRGTQKRTERWSYVNTDMGVSYSLYHDVTSQANKMEPQTISNYNHKNGNILWQEVLWASQ